MTKGWPRAVSGLVLVIVLAFGGRVVAGQPLPPDVPTVSDVTSPGDGSTGDIPVSPTDAAAGETAAPSGATLTGEVLIGPTCPVVRLDRLDQCQDRPYAANLSIQSADGTREVTRVVTDGQGHFTVELDPGTYQIVPLTPPATILPRGIPQTVTLAQGDLTAVVVHYDSGMR